MRKDILMNCLLQHSGYVALLFTKPYTAMNFLPAPLCHICHSKLGNGYTKRSTEPI